MAGNLWSDRPLGVKLAALVAAGAAALGVFALVAVEEFQGAGERVDTLLATNAATAAALEADMMHDAVRGDVLAALVSGGRGPEYQAAAADLADHAENFRAQLDAVEGGLGPEVDAAVDGARGPVEDYLASAGTIVDLASRDLPAARASYPAFGAAFSALEDSLPLVGETVAAAAADAATASAEQRETAITVSLAIAGAGVLVLAVLGWVVTRSVVRPLRRVGAVVSALAEGDLTGESGVDSRDEVGRMAVELGTAMARIREVVAAIGDSSTTLASATGQLSASAQDMARLADESSAQSGVVATAAGQVSGNVHTVAAGSEQMGTSIREIAQNATDVSRVAQQAVVVADSTTTTVAKRGESSLDIAPAAQVLT